MQDVITRTTANFYHQLKVVNAHLPITTGAVSSPIGLGSDSVPVDVELFGERTFLADSAQFLLEYSCRLNVTGCYYLMQSFRGEEPDQTHLNQFMQSEAEVPGTLDDVLLLAEEYVLVLAAAFLNEQASLIQKFAGTTEHLNSVVSGRTSFRRVMFDEVVELAGGNEELVREDPSRMWRTLTRKGEQFLLHYFDSPVWVTYWDHLAVPFYQGYADGGYRYALNADLLLGSGEVVGAGQRHPDGELVRRALNYHRVSDTSGYDWYCEMKDSFPMQTSGFGLGVERFLMWVLRHDDIRDLQIVPRLRGTPQIV
ncbi:MAG: amino acid--tRNA ligase-related protein [Pseudonocardiaceae bacterium]